MKLKESDLTAKYVVCQWRCNGDEEFTVLYKLTPSFYTPRYESDSGRCLDEDLNGYVLLKYKELDDF